MTSEDVEAIKAGIEALSKGTENFAAQRMDRSIRRALFGLNVDDEVFDADSDQQTKDNEQH